MAELLGRVPVNLQNVWDKAESLRGCLAKKRTFQGRRRDQSTEAGDGFTNDEAALLESKSWRTLAFKTQVFTRPENPLIRTRQAHVLEVVAVSVRASELLGLNTQLVRAAAIGHDIGHVPFGHQGEAWMAKAMGRPEFCHEVMAPIIAQKIERRGRGLNLTHETLEAMMCHSGNMAKEGMSQEAWVLRHTDKFTYIFHDINDIVGRMKYPVSRELSALVEEFGDNQRHRVRTAIAGLAIESAELGRVSFEQSELGQKFARLRNLMYEVYPHVTQQNVRGTMESVLEFLTLLNLGDPFLLLALLTDSEASMMASEPMKDLRLFNRTGLSEIVPYLPEIGAVDLCDPDLDW
ncbi:MAG: HD domain-containing protein [Minisyncoccia bacterium]